MIDCVDPNPSVVIPGFYGPRFSPDALMRAAQADNYFVPIPNRWFGNKHGNVWVLAGEHHRREDFNLLCLFNFWTGEKRDLQQETLGMLLASGTWAELNEMELLAWVAQ